MRTELQNSSVRRDVGQILAHLAVFLGLRTLVFSLGSPGESAYRSPILILQLAQSLLSNALFWLPLLALLLLRSRSFASWNVMPFKVPLRWFATGLALMLATTFGGQESNLFFNHEYLIDRMVLLSLAAFVAVRPFFILPFAILTVLLGGQFCFPMSGYEWEVHLLGINRLPIHLLLIIFSGLLFEHKDLTSRCSSTIFLILVVVAAGYWLPGITKLRMGWVTVPNVHYSLFGAWCHGWLFDLDAANVISITNKLRPWAIPLQCATVLFECGALMILIRRCSLVLLPMWIAFHTGAFGMYGYAFWMWLLIDLGLFLFILYHPDSVKFRWQHCLIAMLLISTSGRWLNPNRLAWFNAPLANTYHFVAIGTSGTRYELTPDFFAPYDYIFTMNWFDYLSNKKQLTGPYATTMEKRYATMTGRQLAESQARRGIKKQGPIRTAELTVFLQTYVQNWNAKRHNDSQLQFLKPPALLNTTRPEVVIPADDRIDSVEIVRFQTVLLETAVIREPAEVCLTVPIPQLTSDTEEPE